MLGDLLALAAQTCPSCGSLIIDAALHARFHDSLTETARLALAPHLSPEEWAAALDAELLNRAASDPGRRKLDRKD